MLRFVRSARLSAAALLALAGTAAEADPGDTFWNVFAAFDDGGSLSGTFAIDQYGYLKDRTITSTAGTIFGGFAYTTDNNSRNNTDPTGNSPYFISLNPVADANGPNQPQYTTQLRINFVHTLADVGVVQEEIVVGDQSSFECFGDYGCSGATPTGNVSPRHIVSGFARQVSAGAAPEPATWAMMLVGFGLVGAAIRRPVSYRLSAARAA